MTKKFLLSLLFFIIIWEGWLHMFAIPIFYITDGKKGFEYWINFDLFFIIYKLLKYLI